MVNQEQFKTLSERVSAIEGYLNIPTKRLELKEEELKTQDPEFWNDAKAAEIKMKHIRGLKYWVSTFDELTTKLGDLEVTMEFVKEEMATEEEVDSLAEELTNAIEDLELKNML